MASGAKTLRDALLPVVDTLRGIPATLGMRLYTVTVRVRTWTGGRPGTPGATNVDVDSPLKVASGGGPVKVRQLTQKDVVASGGVYSDQDFEVGPITPPYAGSSLDDDQITNLDPATGANPIEVFFLVAGPGMSGGAWFKKIAQNVSKSYRYTLILRKTGETP